MPKWTEPQLSAIEARNHSILVSAAAGSGKTAVLIERIVRLLREGERLDRMMIVTFTRAAAAEMRQRLNARLAVEIHSDPARMTPALDALESADISTIHHFCQQILKSEFQAVRIDPMARVCEEQQRVLLFDQACRDAMNELLPEEDQPDFRLLVDDFSPKAVHDMAQDLYKFLMSLPEPFAWLDEHVAHVADTPVDEHPWYQVIVGNSARQLQGMGVLLDQQKAMFDEPDAVDKLRVTWEQDAGAYDTLMSLDAGSPQVMAEALKTFAFVRAESARKLTPAQEAWKKRYTTLRTQMKTLVKDLGNAMFINEGRTVAELTVIQQQLRGLSVLVKWLHALFMEAKLKANVVDFNDLEQLTLAVLRDEALRTKLQGQYDHIFVDECQDVSAVQDAIIQQIHGADSILFMVGDVKQSIYRFRLADPTLFLGRMRTWSDAEDAVERRIFLQQNFRSRQAVLDATNRVFRRLMKADVTELDYLQEDELIPGRVTQDDPPVEMHLVDPREDAPDGEPLDPVEAQAAVIIARMQALLGEKLQDGDTVRPYTWRDMVILMPQVSRTGSALAECLQRHGVPVYFDGATSYFGLPEIRSMTALLQIIDDPQQDVYLLAALKLPPFLMTDGELAEIRLHRMGRNEPFHRALTTCGEEDSPVGQRCRAVLAQIREWRFLSQVMRLTDFLWMLVRETGFYASCGALPEGSMRQANLRLLCQRAAEYEDIGGVTLDGFLRQIDQMTAAGDSRSAKELGEGENLVRIMTMHKSKGLEFPVVFLAGLSGALHLRGGRDVQLNSRLGVCMPYVNRSLNIRRATMGTEAFDIQRRLDEKAERARLLYVGMTRARERLIMVGLIKGNEDKVWAMSESDYRIWEAGSMTDWLMQVIHDDAAEIVAEALSTGSPQTANPWQVWFWHHYTQQAVEKSNQVSHIQTWLETVASVPAGDVLGKDWRHIYDEPQSFPLKTSVSALVRKQLTPEGELATDEETEEVKARPLTELVPMLMSELPARPAFLEEAQVSGAQRGTLTHHALALFDLAALRNCPALPKELSRQLSDMTARGIFTPEEARQIDLRRIAGFYGSELGTRLLASSRVEREWSFNLRLPDKQDALLQGVIDCAFLEDTGWVLVDYKTDHIDDETAFVTRYTPQLAWYARALEAITTVPVTSSYLFSLSTGQGFALTTHLRDTAP